MSKAAALKSDRSLRGSNQGGWWRSAGSGRRRKQYYYFRERGPSPPAYTRRTISTYQRSTFHHLSILFLSLSITPRRAKTTRPPFRKPKWVHTLCCNSIPLSTGGGGVAKPVCEGLKPGFNAESLPRHVLVLVGEVQRGRGLDLHPSSTISCTFYVTRLLFFLTHAQ